MNATILAPISPRWRAFDERQARRIDAQARDGAAPCCPECSAPLAVHPEARTADSLPLDAVGYDLECVPCMRFRTVVLHTERSLRLLRMRRLAAAVSAVKQSQAVAA